MSLARKNADGSPPASRQANLSELDDLLAQGEAIRDGMTVHEHPGLQTTSGSFVLEEPWTEYIVDEESFRRWQTTAASVLHYIISVDHPQRELINDFRDAGSSRDNLLRLLSRLRGIRDACAKGLFDSVATKPAKRELGKRLLSLIPWAALLVCIALVIIGVSLLGRESTSDTTMRMWGLELNTRNLGVLVLVIAVALSVFLLKSFKRPLSESPPS